MRFVGEALRGVLAVAWPWALGWCAAWTLIGIGIAVVDPDSMDPGDPLGMVLILGPMGLLSGVVFGLFQAPGGRAEGAAEASTPATLGRGVLATAIVQVLYLGTGDADVAAHLQMAALFCAVGGLVTLAWLGATRGLARRRLRPSLR